MASHSTPPPKVHPPVAKADPDGWDASRPFESRAASSVEHSGFASDAPAAGKKVRQWMRSRGQISISGGPRSHLCALTYMSDSFLLGTVPRVQDIPRYTSPTALKRLDGFRSRSDPDSVLMAKYLGGLARKETMELQENKTQESQNKAVSMLATLSHVIYFHNPDHIKADDWMLSEAQSPWAGEGRGLVIQHLCREAGIWSRLVFRRYVS